ncbi:TetR/AcrR family transcriptional regulator [Micrococcus luteus]|nr:TetR/AcrR family transcriptional regulator [Micrococcus luteus]
MDETPEPPRTRRRRGRPLSPALSRAAIADAALAVARTEGYEGLTMAAVGRRLGVAPSALYNHISGKHELLVLLQDAVMGEVSLVELEAAIRGEAPVVTALRAWARSYRDVFAAHPPLIPLIATLPIEGAPSTQRVYETVCAALARTGLAPKQVLARVIALESFIYGSAYDVDAPADIFEVAGAQERLPAFGAAAEAFRAGGGTRAAGARNPYADAPFEEGLDLLLAGLGD